MSEHYVVKAEPCPVPIAFGTSCQTIMRCFDGSLMPCDGCLRNGLRVVLDGAVPVERMSVTEIPDDADGSVWVEGWVEP